MGDGQDGAGNAMTLGTSRMTGTGFFRPRPIEGSSAGPIYLNGSVCVDQNTEVSISIDGSGNGLPPGISEVTAVAYWMDPRTMEGRDPNRIDLEIEDLTAGTTWTDGANNKEDKRRVHATGAFQNHALWLRLRGVDVRGDSDPWCPPERSQRVFYTVVAE